MCSGCWEGEGSPADWTPQTGRFLDLYRRLYELEPAGGPVHHVVDDWNLDDELIHPTYEVRPGGFSREVHAICDELVELLTAMTMPQRYAALAYAEGFLPLLEETTTQPEPEPELHRDRAGATIEPTEEEGSGVH